jgi:hypothetical protein
VSIPLAIEGLGYCNGQFLGGGYDGSTFGVLSSPDGTNWTRRANLAGNVTKFAYGAGRYVASGYSGKLYVSTNLTDWSTAYTGDTEAMNAVCFGKGLFVTVGSSGRVYASQDGLAWTNVAAAGYMSRVEFMNGAFLAVGKQSQALLSPDGIHWSNLTLPAPLNIWITYGGVAYGNGSIVAAGSRGEVSTSLDFTNWLSRFRGTVENLYGVTYSDGRWIAVGNLGETIASTNGRDWSTLRSQYAGILTAIAGDHGTFVATDDENGYGDLFVSTNLSSWTVEYPQPGPALYAVVHGNSLWVAVGALGARWISQDGINWEVQTLGDGVDLTGITFAQNQFIAVGDQGRVLRSPDGLSWITNYSATAAHLNGITYGKGYFVAVGVSGTVLTSSDGTHWSPESVTPPVTLTAVAFGDDYFAAVGLDGEILTSFDMLNWNFQTTPSSLSLYQIAFGDHSFLAVGEGGMIVQSDPLIRAGILKSNSLVLTISGPTNSSVTVQSTYQLFATNSWQDLAEVFLTNEPTLWVDTNTSAVSSRFYRMRFHDPQ